jgi:hypothetical protein
MSPEQCHAKRNELNAMARVPRKMLERCEKSGDFTAITDWLERNGEKPGVYVS